MIIVRKSSLGRISCSAIFDQGVTSSQSWESGAFERTRGGVRAVTRPAEIGRPINRVPIRFPVSNRLFSE
jgi:hypothetical protein